MVRVLGLLFACSMGCQSAGPAVGDAVLNTAVAAAVAGVRRSQSNCYTHCAAGYVCNRATGYCDRIPCAGECKAWEHCEGKGITERCVINTSGDQLVPRLPPQ